MGGGAAGAWYAGLLDPFLVEPLPVASPYTLTASHDPAGALDVAVLETLADVDEPGDLARARDSVGRRILPSHVGRSRGNDI